MRVEYLNPGKLLVHETAAWLDGQARTSAAGVKTLDHLLVVVPTRQSGRRLRLALAERLGACVPPRVALPSHLTAFPAGLEGAVATEAECVGVLAGLLGALSLPDYPALFPGVTQTDRETFTWRLGIARQLHDVWRILGENALTMADVAAAAENGQVVFPDDREKERWHQLADVERRFFNALRTRGRRHPVEARQAAVAAPAVAPGIETIVLPALADAQPAFFKALERIDGRAPGEGPEIVLLLHAAESERGRFDRWGRPLSDQWTGAHAPAIRLSKGQYLLAADNVQQAKRVADLVDSVNAADELPGIGVADDTLFDALQASLSAVGKRLHSPVPVPFNGSSLGHLVNQLVWLFRDPVYPVFAALLRESDVQRCLERTFQDDSSFSFPAVLQALDALHKRHLPQTFADVRRSCGTEPAWESLRKAVEIVGRWLEPGAGGRSRAAHLRDVLKEIFASRRLDEQCPGDRELLAASGALNAVLEAADGDWLRQALPDDTERTQLFESLLASASYSLEPDDPDVIMTDGWLELAWNPASELVIAGFNEGCIPESVVGHAFVPDSLRKALGLPNNEQRTARDIYLFRSLLNARAPGAVTVLLERMNARGDVCKPSRLLLLCGDDDDALAARVLELYGEADRPALGHVRTVPGPWRLKWPVPVSPDRDGEAVAAGGGPLSGWPSVQTPARLRVTAFKDYLASPFSFFLKQVLNMQRCDDRDRELDFMEFGTLCHGILEAFGKGACRDSEDPDAIEHALCSELDARMDERFGRVRSTVLRLQEESLRRRFSFFAREQARLASSGWHILETERTVSAERDGMTVRGKIDRIDICERDGVCRILDYKTWPAKKGEDSFSGAGKKQLAFAQARGFGAFPQGGQGRLRVWTDLQLPLYQWLAGQLGPVVSGDFRIECGYFVLGDTAAGTGCECWDFAPLQASADETVREIIRRVRAGIFWPVGTLSEDFAPLFPDKPEEGISPEWIADQEQRLSRLTGGTAPVAADDRTRAAKG